MEDKKPADSLSKSQIDEMDELAKKILSTCQEDAKDIRVAMGALHQAFLTLGSHCFGMVQFITHLEESIKMMKETAMEIPKK